jgi:uncharacterized membrane protein (DUF4010 family)
MPDSGSWIGLVVALGVGLLVGIERERRKGRGPERQAAGLRTFALVAVAGALAQSLAPGALVAVGGAAVAALAALGYWRSARGRKAEHDPGMTTEVALVVTYLVGVQCTVQPVIGAGCGALLAGLLAARERLHRFATEALSEVELRDALVLAGVALVVVPLAPVERWPWLGGLSPRTAAWLVLVILGLQAAAHVARRLVGERRALPLAGLLGGFVSSTATIATFGARARGLDDAAAVRRLAVAATMSGAATWLHALVLAAVVSPALLPLLVLPAAAGAAAIALSAAGTRSRDSGAAAGISLDGRRPLRLREAMLVAVLLLVVSAAVSWLRARFGTEGLLAGAALAALADAHSPIAAAFGLHAAGTIEARDALHVLLVAIGVNTASRSVVALMAGGARFGLRVAAGLWASTTLAALVLLMPA